VTEYEYHYSPPTIRIPKSFAHKHKHTSIHDHHHYFSLQYRIQIVFEEEKTANTNTIRFEEKNNRNMNTTPVLHRLQNKEKPMQNNFEASVWENFSSAAVSLRLCLQVGLGWVRLVQN